MMFGIEKIFAVAHKQYILVTFQWVIEFWF